MAIRVLIADDHGVVRQGLKMFLSLDSDIEVVGEAENGREAVAMARELTERETEVLKLLARGRANKQIASALFVEEKTVKTHVSSMLGKLGLRSRTQAALHAVRTGLVSVDELGEESW